MNKKKKQTVEGMEEENRWKLPYTLETVDSDKRKAKEDFSRMIDLIPPETFISSEKLVIHVGFHPYLRLWCESHMSEDSIGGRDLIPGGSSEEEMVTEYHKIKKRRTR